MIRYKKYQVTGEQSPLKGLWYARPVIEETFDTEKLAKHMANHNTPYSAGVIKGVLADMISCIKELILDGKNVKLDDLAIFSVGIVSKKGAQSAEAFSLANNVKGLKLRARATGELSNAQINLEGQLKEASPYLVNTQSSENDPGNSSGGSGGGEGDNPLG
ncbi:MAG: DNA-binding protein [Bacteroides sp.]|nr:DNA-binding protein [Bacteroides sp.]